VSKDGEDCCSSSRELLVRDVFQTQNLVPCGDACGHQLIASCELHHPITAHADRQDPQPQSWQCVSLAALP
jgi:murein endopeptidase